MKCDPEDFLPLTGLMNLTSINMKRPLSDDDRLCLSPLLQLPSLTSLDIDLEGIHALDSLELLTNLRM
ncbi:MAG: hypothetical protein ACK5UB_14180, partial [Pseudanabaena sp.]